MKRLFLLLHGISAIAADPVRTEPFTRSISSPTRRVLFIFRRNSALAALLCAAW